MLKLWLNIEIKNIFGQFLFVRSKSVSCLTCYAKTKKDDEFKRLIYFKI